MNAPERAAKTAAELETRPASGGETARPNANGASHPTVQLQQTVGNQAVQQLLAGISASGEVDWSSLLAAGSFHLQKAMLDAEVERDFNFLVHQIDENRQLAPWGMQRNEGKILDILRRWGEEKFTAYPRAYPNGGQYLDDLFSKLYNKTKVLEGWVTDEWTNYYSLLFNHFKRDDELKEIRDKYSLNFRSDGGLQELSVAAFLWDDLTGPAWRRVGAFALAVGKGAWSAGKGLATFAYTLITDPGKAWDEISHLPGNLKKLWENRGERWKEFISATPEKQAKMIGELIGQVEFAIVTAPVGGMVGEGLSSLAQLPGLLGKAARALQMITSIPGRVIGTVAKGAGVALKGAAQGAIWAARGGYKFGGKVLRGTWSVVEQTVGKVTRKVFYFWDDAAERLMPVEENVAQRSIGNIETDVVDDAFAKLERGEIPQEDDLLTFERRSKGKPADPKKIPDIGRGVTRELAAKVRVVMGKTIAQAPTEVREAWAKAVAYAREGLSGEMKAEAMIQAYSKAQRRFWENVRGNGAARTWFENNGFWFDEAASGAPYVEAIRGLDRTGTLQQELRVSLDHILEKAENPALALDAGNLRFTMQWDNWLLNQIGNLLKKAM